jgi:MbtH protein
MTVNNEEDKILYSVVINHEGQYSIWPTGKEMPGGWQKQGKDGSKSECLEYINKVWTDIRPRSIRRKPGGNRQD